MKFHRLFPAVLAITATAAHAETEDTLPWTLSLAGGSTTMEQQGDQPFVSLSLTRTFGEAYVRVAGTYVDTSDGQGLIGAVPAKTLQGTISAGHSFGDLSVDGYASLGKRTFGSEAYRRATGQVVSISSNGSTAGAGLSLTYDWAVGRSTFLSPFVSIDYSRVDIARAVTLPTLGLVSQKEKQDGVTGAAGATLQHVFGKKAGHSVGLNAAFVTTSNATAYNRGGAPLLATRVLGLLDAPGSKDSWSEIGALASFRLSRGLRADLNLVQTLGFAGSEATSASVGLRISF